MHCATAALSSPSTASQQWFKNVLPRVSSSLFEQNVCLSCSIYHFPDLSLIYSSKSMLNKGIPDTVAILIVILCYAVGHTGRFKKHFQFGLFSVNLTWDVRVWHHMCKYIIQFDLKKRLSVSSMNVFLICVKRGDNFDSAGDICKLKQHSPHPDTTGSARLSPQIESRLIW